MLKKKLEQKEAAENRAYLDLQLKQKELEEEALRVAIAEDAKKQKRDLEIWNLEEAEKRCVYMRASAVSWRSIQYPNGLLASGVEWSDSKDRNRAAVVWYLSIPVAQRDGPTPIVPHSLTRGCVCARAGRRVS